jgi:hypothetical protein
MADGHELHEINRSCPLRDACVVQAKSAWIETQTLVPPKAAWLFADGDAIEVLTLRCRTHDRRFAVVPYTNPEQQPDVAIHELLAS